MKNIFNFLSKIFFSNEAPVGLISLGIKINTKSQRANCTVEHFCHEAKFFNHKNIQDDFVLKTIWSFID